MIPFGSYLPDLPALENPGATVANNVIPRLKGPDGGTVYGPLANTSITGSALPSRVLGAFSCKDYDGNSETFAGTTTALFRLVSGVWDDVTGTAYTTADDETWEFAQFGLRVLATGFNDAIQSYVIGTSTDFANLAAAAPRARHLAVVKEFVMALNTSDPTDGVVPHRAWWCAIDDPTNWPTPGTASAASVQSDRQDLMVGGWGQSIIGAVGGADGAVFKETAIYRIAYEGPPTVFGFYEIERAQGTPFPNSVVNVGPFAVYIGQDGFYRFNGAASEPIGERRVDRTILADIDMNYRHRVYGVADHDQHLIFWAYPTTAATSGNPNRLASWNWVTGDFSVSDGLAFELIFPEFPKGLTLEDLDTISTSLDTLPLSLDSRAWTGGRRRIAGFNGSNQLVTFQGTNLAATLETGEFGSPSGRRVRVNGFRPLVDGGTITGLVRSRNLLSESLTNSVSQSANPGTGIVPARIDARYVRARVSIAAGGTWTHAQGIEPVMMEGSQR